MASDQSLSIDSIGRNGQPTNFGNFGTAMKQLHCFNLAR